MHHVEEAYDKKYTITCLSAKDLIAINHQSSPIGGCSLKVHVKFWADLGHDFTFSPACSFCLQEQLQMKCFIILFLLLLPSGTRNLCNQSSPYSQFKIKYMSLLFLFFYPQKQDVTPIMKFNCFALNSKSTNSFVLT